MITEAELVDRDSLEEPDAANRRTIPILSYDQATKKG